MLSGYDNKFKNYDYDVDLNGSTSCAHIIRMIGHNKRVLELGPGPGAITKHLKNVSNCSVVAIENDEKAIMQLDKYCEKVYKLDLNDDGWLDKVSNEKKFDVVLAADVLEHLYDPWSVLKAMASMTADDGFMIVSLPHIGNNAVVAAILAGDFKYQELGLLDRTHIRFFAMKNIKDLFQSMCIKVDDAKFVMLSPENTELKEFWAELPGRLKQYLSKNKYGMVYQVVVKTLPKTDLGEGVDLTTLNVDMSEYSYGDKCKKIVYLYLPPKLIKLIRNIYMKIKKWM